MRRSNGRSSHVAQATFSMEGAREKQFKILYPETAFNDEEE